MKNIDILRKKIYINIMKNSKIKRFFIVLLIFLISSNFFGCFDNAKINILNADLDDVIQKIELLENISKDYDENDYIKRTMIYIRCKKYDSLQWTVLGGKLRNDFEGYVAQKQGETNLQELQYISYIIDPITETQIDFLHMFATMNLVFIDTQLGDLGGWGGDLCQLVKEVSNQTLTDKQLENLIRQKFNHESSFNSQDLLADIDAVNIINQYGKQSQKSISKAMKNYYEYNSQEMRVENFKNYLFGEATNTNFDEKCTMLFDRLKNNSGIRELCNSYEIDFETNQKEFELCIKVFANFFE